ncbi:MAG TPA: site-2 protease family protein [Polyangiaceae bacterium]|nr:site-2 protease family protein [Polyangiaceae bacterium]
MKWSYRLLRVSGIDIRVHATMLIMVALVAFDFRNLYGAAGLGFGALFACALFVCITLHELGHSLVAQRFGVEVKEIVLLPIGGVAMLRSEPSKAWQELLIAVAGPFVNVVIAFALALALRGEISFLDKAVPSLSLHGFAEWLVLSNMILAVFNMIPALPMDGGRALRAVLTMVFDKPRATRIAAGLGQVLAVGFIVWALFEVQSPILALIGAFVFFAAGQERNFQQAATVLRELRAGEVCNPDAAALSPSDPLGVVLDQVLRSPQPAFVVLHGHELVGIVSRQDVLHAAPVLGPSALISKIVRRDFVAVKADLPLDQVRARMMEARGPVVVMSPEGVLGVLTYEDLQRVAGAMQELSKRGLTRPVPAPAPEA